MIGSINDWKSEMGMSLLLHIRGNLGELGEGGLEVFDEFGGDDVGFGKTGAIFEDFEYQMFGREPIFFPRVFLANTSMSAIGILCHWNLAPPAATRFPSSIIIAVIVLPHRRQFRRGPLMRNTCSKR